MLQLHIRDFPKFHVEQANLANFVAKFASIG